MRYFLISMVAGIWTSLNCYPETPPSVAPTFEFIQKLAEAAETAYKKKSFSDQALPNRIRETVNASEATQPGLYDSLLAATCHNIGRTLKETNHPDEARPFFEEALRLRRRLYQDDFSQKDILRGYCMIGVTYAESKNMDARKALGYLVDSTRLCPWNSITAGSHIFALKNAGDTYLSINELAHAKASFQAAYDSSRVYNNPLPTPINIELYKAYISCSRQLKEFGMGLRLYKEGILLDPENTIQAGNFEVLAGNIWQDSMKQCTQPSLRNQARENAKAHISRAMAIYRYEGSDGAKELAVLEIGNLGALYYRSGQYLQAVDLLYNALIDTAFKNVPLSKFAPLQLNMADALCAMGKLEAGVYHYQEAIKCLIPGGKTEKLTDFNVEDWPDLWYLYGAIAKTQLRRYQAQQQPEILAKVMDAYQSMMQLTNLTRSERLSEQTKFDLAERSQEALATAIGVCAQLYKLSAKESYKTKAFSFAEQSKGFALLEAVRLRQLNAANPDQKQRQESALQEIPMHEFQSKLLSRDQGLVSFFTQDTILHVFLIRTDTLIWKQSIVQLDSLKNRVERFQYLLQDPSQSTLRNPEKEKELGTLGHLLYQSLLSPLKGLMPARLVIVPSAPFLGLPFEALSEQPFSGSLEQQVRQNNLLLFQYSISYAVSANIWAEMQKARTSSRLLQEVAAFAPSFNLSSDSSELAGILAPMANTQIEVNRISQKVPVSIFSTTNATRSTFLEASRQYNILHVASHSLCDDRDPNQSLLAFNQPGPFVDTSQLLYLRELYGLDLHQDLIVLSACETSRGEFAVGEGNLSIARGLAYAGAHSFISTLWVINTEPGLTIMPAFYEKLRENTPKDVALAEAKRSYLRESSKNYAPLKWAGIVLNGSTQPISFSESGSLFSWYWLIAALPVLFAILLFWRQPPRK